MPNLVLGWHVGEDLDPPYWTNPNARLGGHKSSDLLQVPPAACAAHTAVIAQSGSGKSYFLGRFVEEVALATRARCLILDPNADFRRVAQVMDESLWTEARYDVSQQRGRLPHEVSRSKFVAQWQKVPIRVRGGLQSADPPMTPLTVPWHSVSAEFLAEDLGPVDKIGVQNCHNFVREIHDLLVLRSLVGQRELVDYLSGSERLLRHALTSPEDFSATVREEWGLSTLPQRTERGVADSVKAILGISDLNSEDVRRAIERRLEGALAAARSIGETARQFYFGKLGACRATGVIARDFSPALASSQTPPRIDVLDLPSIDDSTRLLVANAVLQAEWDIARQSWEIALRNPSDADTRVPLLIVVDEAHNLIPREPRNKSEAAIRDQFRTFVAEGRKYGVFVVLVTQRPDKIDPIVLSECENRAVMKLSSESTVNLTRNALGLEDVPPETLLRCLTFRIGRALMVGPWATQGPCIIYSAARRTVEGGRNLRHEYWTSDPCARV